MKSFIDGHLREEGEEFEFSGIPGTSLHPLDDEAKIAKVKAGTGEKVFTKDVASTDDENDLQSLREQYKDLYGEDPHPAKKALKLRQDIADKRKELGV